MSSQLLRCVRGFFHSQTFHGLLIYNVCSLQIVTEQETCLTKHNGGTRPLLTLLGSGGLPAAGCEQSSRTKENNIKEAGDWFQRGEQTVFSSSSNNDFLPGFVCVLVCAVRDQEDKKVISVQSYNEVDWILAPFLLLINVMALSKTLTFFLRLSSRISQIDMVISAMKIKRWKRILMHLCIP